MSAPQLKLSEREQERLRSRIWNDFQGARSNHEARIRRFRRYYRMWRGLEESMGSKDGPDFQVPMLKWITFGHWSRCMQALLGDDAQVVAAGTAPEGEKISAKVGGYLTWRIFEYMKATPALATWVFRTILFGRGIAELQYEQEYFWEREDSGEDKETLYYDGPRLISLWPTQLILPAQDDCNYVDDFEWKIRRHRVTPQQLLDGERHGRYQGVRDNWDQIAAFAQKSQERDYEWDDEKLDKDQAEGVEHGSLLGNRNSIEMWDWYGKWRMPKSRRGASGHSDENLDSRNDRQSEIVVSYLPRLQLIVGAQDLADIYPKMRQRHPFVDIGLVKDGSFWCPGIGEIIEDLQREATTNHALFRRAGMFSVGPLIFYRPSSGFDPETYEYSPNKAIPTEDPAGVNVVRMQADLKYPEMMGQLLKTIAELVTGVNDQTVGQSVDRPNAPRTLGGQMLLAEGANTRAWLDMAMLREDLSKFIERVWLLDREFSDEEVFFRVTEEDADGLYDVDSGFGKMSAAEREHNFDFDLKFATSVFSRESKKQSLLALYQLSMQNPLVAQNPRALWVLLNKIWTAFGEKNFKDIIPAPPETEQPKDPKEEWADIEQGEEVHVNPLDDDDQHLIDHRRRLEHEINEPADRRNPRTEHMAVAHIIEHERQKRQKMVLQVLAQKAMAEMQQQQGAEPGGLGPVTPIPAPAPAVPVPPVAPAGPPAPGMPQ